ncbi:coronatine-insensitive protein homolog 2 isoform X1 [Phragmites australis]|uniref:coronatine-insensitive protein homolog 2 isoform X1 n=1 Tax=Phragmites australis TaxID=29695 RepID=UPI002D780074|nr:coronatine-insensitive protein homolog 2 isoform X1 [Phragmites australis]
MGGEGEDGERRLGRALSFGIPDTALGLVMGYVEDPWDRDAISLVCRHWCRVDALSRKHVTVAMAYSTTPERLFRRFPCLESLKLKAKPRAAMFNLISDDWGGSASPWIRQLSASFHSLKALHLRRMIVSDDDIDVLVRAKARMLVALKLDRCSGFSTSSLALVARCCKKLETLFLEESTIAEKENDEWIRELAANNSVLETLNFFLTDLSASPEYLTLLVRSCQRLETLKISECLMPDLITLFRTAQTLQDFAGGSFDDEDHAAERRNYESYYFPPSLHRLCLLYMGPNEMQILFPYAAALKKLDLQFTFLSTEDHCQIVQRCPNLETLEVRDVIGDRGLEVIAQTCKKLRRLRVERGDDDQGGLEDEQGRVSQVGLMAIAQGCPELTYWAVHVSDITNAALEAIGTFNRNLNDFRLVLLDREAHITELPLDNGVRALLRGCTKLRRFAFYVRPGALSDVGLGYVGEFSKNIRYMLLGNVGQSDHGLLQLSIGCPSLQKLELRGCFFTERALAIAALQLKSLRYLWVQGYKASPTGTDLMAMGRPFWNIELIAPDQNDPCAEGKAQILAYYSLAGRRSDCPPSVIPLYPAV